MRPILLGLGACLLGLSLGGTARAADGDEGVDARRFRPVYRPFYRPFYRVYDYRPYYPVYNYPIYYYPVYNYPIYVYPPTVYVYPQTIVVTPPTDPNRGNPSGR
jgi:hypothetical protein